jgi:hypothetical protein
VKKLSLVILSLAITIVFTSSLWAQCVELEAPAVDVPYDSVKEADTRPGVTYLSTVGGDTPAPNACGLNPSNDSGEWDGWGGPLDTDNTTIGEGAGTRNFVIIGGVYFKRGIGTHAVGTFVFDLTGGDYATFDCYVGMGDEKDAGATGAADSCGGGGTGDFIFSLDGVEVEATETLPGWDHDNDVNMPAERVNFDVSGAAELTIVMGDGGDGNGCDHSAIGDPKLMAPGVTAVEPDDSLSTTWGKIKTR